MSTTTKLPERLVWILETDGERYSVDESSVGSKGLIMIESPFSPNQHRTLEQNIFYAREAMADALIRGGAPIVPHLLYGMVSKDLLRGYVPDSETDLMLIGREQALQRCRQIRQRCDQTHFYIDAGLSSGMAQAYLECLRDNTRHRFVELSSPRTPQALEAEEKIRKIFKDWETEPGVWARRSTGFLPREAVKELPDQHQAS